MSNQFPEGQRAPGGLEAQTLSGRDRELVKRYFGNPLEFPAIFKGWLESYLDPLVRSIVSAHAAPGGGSLQAGDIIFRAGAVRAGFVACNGATYDGTDPTYTPLWNDIGLAFGGTGQSAFKVPDIQGRTVVVKGTHADVDTLGDNEGVATVAYRRPKHQTSLTDPGHAHTITGYQFGGPNSTADAATASPVANPTSTNTTGITVGSGNANDPVDQPAFIVLNAQIKL